ncbi:MAG: hypothetical protein AAFR21_08815 [Pseudomonadota bacterium]
MDDAFAGGRGPGFDRATVETGLRRVLKSAQFAESARLSRLLHHIVTESLEGRADSLKGYSLGIDVFDRPSSFDPGTDTIVRVHASKLRSRLDLYYATEGAGDPIRIGVPKGQYAPVFERSSNGKVLAPDVETRSTNGAAPPIVAVMPFENLHHSSEYDAIALAFSVDVLSALSRFRELRVLSRHTTWHYQGERPVPRVLGKELGADYLVEGTYRCSANSVRVTAHLVCTKTGEEMLSESFDRDLSAQSHREIQDDVASRIAALIGDPSGTVHRAALHLPTETHELDAYQARMIASDYWRNPNAEAHGRTRTLLERAIDIDPNYAGAWGMLSHLYGDEFRFGFNQEKPDPLQRSLKAAERSIALDSTNVTGFHALFLTQFNLRNVEAFADAADRAFALNPNATDMLADVAYCYALADCLPEARDAIARAFALSPNPPGFYHGVSFTIEFVDQNYDAALIATRKIGDGLWVGAEIYQAMCLSLLGRFEEANEALREFETTGRRAKEFLNSVFEIWNMPQFVRERASDAIERIYQN